MNRESVEHMRTVPLVPRPREAVAAVAVVAPLAITCEERRPYFLRFIVEVRDS